MTDQIKEIADRCRRMETRLTKFLEIQGFDTKTQKPVWKHGVIDIPSMLCGVSDILAVVPSDWNRDDELIVIHKGEEVMCLFLP